jgi:hypothetical protein
MSDKIRDTEAKITDKYNKQVQRGENILNTDPTLTIKLTEFKVLLRDMSVDFKNRKNAVSSETSILSGLESIDKNTPSSFTGITEKEFHETTLKQLSDLESGLHVDKQKTTMLIGMTIVLIFLQMGTFVFM